MNLKLGSIPLKIHPSFLLVSVFLGMNEREPVTLALWVAVVFVSVLLHELGHALVGRAFGLTPRIELQGMGGMTYFEAARDELSAWRSIAISLAGPFAGFAFALAVILLKRRLGVADQPLARDAFRFLLRVNVGWGVFNLVPMLPLDGGRVLQSISRAASPTRGDAIAHGVSIAVACVLGLFAFRFGMWWVIYLAAIHAFQNVQALRGVSRRRTDEAVLSVLHAAQSAIDREDPAAAVVLLEPALAAPASAELRSVAARMCARALLQQARWAEAMAFLDHEARAIGAEELMHYAAGLRELGRIEDAERLEARCTSAAPLTDFRA